MKRKLLTLLIVFCATTGLWADGTEIDGIYYILEGDSATVTSSSSSNSYTGSIVIPSSVTYNGTTYSVTSIGSLAFCGSTGLVSVTIGNSVTSIGYRAFYNCISLTSVTIGNSVTDIGKGAFSACTSLTSISIPNSVTSIGSSAFDGCTGLTSITIPDNVTSMDDYVFSGCTSLTSISIPNSVTSIGQEAFSSCTSLTSITIPNSVTSIGFSAFFNVPNVVYYGSASGSPWGAKCVNGYVDGYLVYSDSTKTNLLACSTAATGIIVIPNSVTGIGDNAFCNCINLTSITIGNGVTSIGYRVFSFCTGLASVTIGNNVKSIGACAFDGCSSLSSVTIGNGVTSIESGAFEDCTSLTSIVIPDSVTSIGSSAFLRCINLTSITIPNRVTSIGSSAFSGCTGLSSIICYAVVPPTLGSNVFSNTPISTTTLYIPNASIEEYESANQWKNFIIKGVITTNVNNKEYGTISISIAQQPDSCILTATSNYGYHFTQWSDGNTNNPRTIVVIKDATYTAEFAKNIYAVTIDAKHGEVTGVGAFNYLDTISFSVTADYGYHFTQWSDGNKDNPRTIVVTKDSVFTVEMTKNTYSITATAEQGKITGVGTYNYLDTITLKVSTNYGYHFTQWSDGNTDNPRTIVVTKDEAYKAEFAKNIYTITANAKNGEVSGSGNYSYLDTISLIASANYGYHFVRWADGNTSNPRTMVVTKDVTYTVIFSKNTYIVTGNAEHGTIIGTGTHYYLDTISLSVTSDYGYHFTQWSDGNTDNPRTIVVTKDSIFTAEFAKNKYIITASTEFGEVTGGGTYEYLDNVELQVKSDVYGYHFAQWSDGNTDNPRKIVVTKDATYTAVFAKNIYIVTGNAGHGTITGTGRHYYLDTISLSAISYYGYHFTQWSDGNTDNPRTTVVTQDVTYTAQFAKNTYIITGNAEHGTITGSGTYNYLDTISLSVSIDYGYYFIQWSDGITDNPRTIVVTQNATYTAEYGKNSYTITTKSEFGEVVGAGTYYYLDTISLNVSANYGYHFAQWSDGNTNNPRVVVVTKDESYIAAIGKDYTGACGDNINWYYANGTLTITGAGDMYNYAIDSVPWILFRDSITSVVFSGDISSIGAYAFYGLTNRGFTKLILPQTVETIGTYAFANCTRLTSITLSTSLLEIADYAFSGCKNVNDITCMASVHPDIYENTFSGVSNYAYLYVPCDYKRSYLLDENWSRFDIQCAGAEEATTTDLTVTPGTTDATFTWPTNTSADTYTLEIKKDGVVFCTLVFNVNGQLTSIAFAPSRNGANKATMATATANGYRFTVTGLSEASHYTFNFDVKDASNQSVKTYTGEFNTQGGIATSVDDINAEVSVEKFIQNGKLYIRTANGIYDATGRMIE